MAGKVYEREVELFQQHGGSLRMAEALRLGINRRTLYAMRDGGVVERVSRGVYRVASLEAPAPSGELPRISDYVNLMLCCGRPRVVYAS